MSNIQELNNIASQVRRDIIRMVTAAQSGHPGGSLSSTDIMTALFFSEMKHSPANWNRNGKDNDMFFLDKIRDVEGVEDATLIQYNGEYHG